MIAKWIIIAFCAIGALLTVSMVGRPRKPLTPNTAALSVAISAAEIIAIILWWKS